MPQLAHVTKIYLFGHSTWLGPSHVSRRTMNCAIYAHTKHMHKRGHTAHSPHTSHHSRDTRQGKIVSNRKIDIKKRTDGLSVYPSVYISGKTR